MRLLISLLMTVAFNLSAKQSLSQKLTASDIVKITAPSQAKAHTFLQSKGYYLKTTSNPFNFLTVYEYLHNNTNYFAKFHYDKTSPSLNSFILYTNDEVYVETLLKQFKAIGYKFSFEDKGYRYFGDTGPWESKEYRYGKKFLKIQENLTVDNFIKYVFEIQFGQKVEVLNAEK